MTMLWIRNRIPLVKLVVVMGSSLKPRSLLIVSQRCPNWPVLKSCFCVQGGRTVEHVLGSVGLYHTGRTVEHALGVCGPVSHGQFSVFYRGQDCRTYSGVCGLYHTGSFRCVLGGRTVEHALGSVGLYHTGSFRCVTGGRTVHYALGSVDLYHTGSFQCVIDPGVACGHAADSVQFGVSTLWSAAGDRVDGWGHPVCSRQKWWPIIVLCRVVFFSICSPSLQ